MRPSKGTTLHYKKSLPYETISKFPAACCRDPRLSKIQGGQSESSVIDGTWSREGHACGAKGNDAASDIPGASYFIEMSNGSIRGDEDTSIAGEATADDEQSVRGEGIIAGGKDIPMREAT